MEKENLAPRMVWGSPLEPPSKRRPTTTTPSSSTTKTKNTVRLFLPPPPLCVPVVSTESSTSISTLSAAPVVSVSTKKRGRTHAPSVLMTLPVPHPNVPIKTDHDHHRVRSNLTAKADLMTVSIPPPMINPPLPSPAVIVSHPTCRTATHLSVSSQSNHPVKHSINTIDLASLTLSDTNHVVVTHDDVQDTDTTKSSDSIVKPNTTKTLIAPQFDDVAAVAAAAAEEEEEEEEEVGEEEEEAEKEEDKEEEQEAEAEVEEVEVVKLEAKADKSSSSLSSASASVYRSPIDTPSQTYQSTPTGPSPISQSNLTAPSQIAQSNLVILDACEVDDRKHSIWRQAWFLPMLQVTSNRYEYSFYHDNTPYNTPYGANYSTLNTSAILPCLYNHLIPHNLVFFVL